VTARDSLPTDLAAAHALILAERAARVEAEARLADARAEAANARADLTSTEAFISHLKLEIEKLRRQLYGSSACDVRGVRDRCRRRSCSGCMPFLQQERLRKISDNDQGLLGCPAGTPAPCAIMH
jgi:hypothetical protein